MNSSAGKDSPAPRRHILVTGARGAIGRHVVRTAKDRGYFVTGLGHGLWTDDSELPAIDDWRNGDVTPENISALTNVHGIPYAIVHLAGGSHVGSSIDQPGEDFQRTVLSAQRLLDWLRSSSRSAKLVVASSAAVYGIGHDGPIKETAHCTPLSPYGTHKAMIEIMTKGYAAQFGLSTTILRLFSVYGPGLRKQLIWEITNRLLRGERAITLAGTGQECRDFVEISDAAKMLLDAIELAGPMSPVFNCCSGKSTTVNTVATELAKHFPGVSFTFSGQTRSGDPTSLVGDHSLASSKGISASIPFARGLTQTIEHIKKLSLRKTES